MGSELKYLAVLAITLLALHSTVAEETHVVGDELGWIVPPGGHYAYEFWAAGHEFSVGDILEFDFKTGDQDVAMVTKKAFNSCNSTSPIEIKTTGPANFTLDTIGEYYFIGTMDKHCELGQKLAINVTTTNSDGPSASPAYSPAPAPRGAVAFTVGEEFGWFVAGESAYSAWAYGKTFIIGDALVFNFINGTQDVAVVTKSTYENCTTNSTIAVYSDSPVIIVLDKAGEHYFTSTYDRHCEFGQKLAINVTGKSTGTPSKSPTSSIAPSSLAPSAQSAHSPDAAPGPYSSAPSNLKGSGYFITFLLVALAFFH